MRVGILGCGYVGHAIAVRWKQSGHQISVTTRKFERIPQLKSCADHVYHLGSQPLQAFIDQQDVLAICVAPDHPSEYTSAYLDTAQQVAERALQTSTLKQILYTSSVSVYEDRAGAWVDEETPLSPILEKPRILYEAEQALLGCASENLNVCLLRLGEIYGPGREIENRLRRMLHQPFAGTGDSFTNIIHLADILNALDFSLQHQLQGIYNLCSDYHVPRHLFYREICKREGLPPIQWDPKRQSAHGGNRRVSNQKIKSKGFTFTYPRYL